jgi:excisionase family DNA binding protein
MKQRRAKTMNDNLNNQRLAVSPVEAGNLLGVSRPTIFRMLNLGVIHKTKLGNRTLIPVQSLRKLLAAAAGGVNEQQ